MKPREKKFGTFFSLKNAKIARKNRVCEKKCFRKNGIKIKLTEVNQSFQKGFSMKCLKFVTILSVLFGGGLCAHLHPCAGGFALDAEYLYLYPSVDDTYFVISNSATTLNPAGTRQNNDFNFASGFRVGATYGFCECNSEFSAYYTRLRTKQSRSISGDHLWATVGRSDTISAAFEDYAGTADSSLDLLYQRVDGLFEHQVWCNCGFDVAAVAGLEYAYLRLNEDINYRTFGGTLSTVHQHGKTWGVGPQFGFETAYAFWQCDSCLPGTLAVTTFTTGSILASKTTMNNLQHAGAASTETLNISDNHTWRVVPAFHARVGLNYTTCFSCFGASLEVGYEFNTYLRGLARYINPDDVADALTFTNYYNFDTQGLYVAVNVSF